MSAPHGIVIVASEPETVRSVSSAIAHNGRFHPGPVCRGMPELLALLAETPPPAVIVDIDPDPRQVLRELEPVIASYPHTRFIVLSKNVENDLMLEAMGVGARHILSKVSLADDLNGILGRISLNGHAGKQDRQSAVVTVLSASGGSGGTTISVNLANELHLLTSEPSLVADMDLAYGGVAAYLGLRGQYGIADVLAGGLRIDSNLVSTTAVVHSSGLHVLLSPATTSFSRPAALSVEHIERVLKAFRAAYTHTVIDAPRVGMDVAAELAAESVLTIIVFQLTVKDVRIARDMQSALSERGVSPDRVIPIANRYRKRGYMLTIDEAAKALVTPPLVVSNDWKSAIQCLNFGKLLSQGARRSAIRDDIQKLASRVASLRAARAKSPS